MNLATALHLAEPLEEHTMRDRAGILITIAYAYYVLRDQVQALQIAQNACTRFADDPLLTRIVALLSS